MKKGDIVDIYQDYKSKKKFLGRAILLMRDNRKESLTFSDTDEDESIIKINRYIDLNPLIEGEFDGKEYKIKPKKLKFKLYSSQYWLVEFVSSTYYESGFRKWFRIRYEAGSYKDLREISRLTTHPMTMDDAFELEEETDDISSEQSDIWWD